MRPVAKYLSMTAGLFALAVSAGAGTALAHDHGHGHGWKHGHNKQLFIPPGHVHYYYAAPPVVLVPRPVIYREEPRYYGPPTPSLNINIPLH